MALVLLTATLLFAVPAGAQQPDSIRYNESFNPLELNEPRKGFFEEESQEETARWISSDTTKFTGIREQEESSNIGFRVQLVATPNYHEADSLITTVRNTFVENMDTTKAYLIYDSPNYKIRLGNCKTRDDAEELLQRAKAEGFRYAWIVRSRISPEGGNSSP